MCNDHVVSYRHHISGGHYVTVTTSIRCVDFRKFYVPYGQQEVKPTKKGVALRLSEWADMRNLVEGINTNHTSVDCVPFTCRCLNVYKVLRTISICRNDAT